MKGRAVGKIKRALLEAKKDRTDVTADYGTAEVYVANKKVAWWKGETLKLKGEAFQLKERIEELIAERPRAPSDSE